GPGRNNEYDAARHADASRESSSSLPPGIAQLAFPARPVPPVGLSGTQSMSASLAHPAGNPLSQDGLPSVPHRASVPTLHDIRPHARPDDRSIRPRPTAPEE